jgi:hypothetical protein
MFYMTDMLALPIGLLWLMGLAVVVRAHWRRIAEIYAGIKAKLAAGDEKEEEEGEQSKG